MGRQKLNTVQITTRIDQGILEELHMVNPSLLTVDPVSRKIKFRHGALSRYITRLIRKDIDERRDKDEENVLSDFMRGDS